MGRRTWSGSVDILPVHRRVHTQRRAPVLDDGKTVSTGARDLDLTETVFREWVKRARANRTNGRGLTTAEREELVRLRRAIPRAPIALVVRAGGRTSKKTAKP